MPYKFFRFRFRESESEKRFFFAFESVSDKWINIQCNLATPDYSSVSNVLSGSAFPFNHISMMFHI